MIVALTSVRGAPGTSLWSMLLAAAWPDSYDVERVVFEADTDGGVMGARYGVGVEPGTNAFAAMLRRESDPSDALHQSGRHIDERGWLVPGPVSPLAASRLWGVAGAATTVSASLAADARRVWMCDLGRAHGRSPNAAFIENASMTILMSRDQPADLVQLPDRVADLGAICREVGVVVVGKPEYDNNELTQFIGARHVWVVRSGFADIENTQRGWHDRRLRRSGAWRDALRVAEAAADTVMWNTVGDAPDNVGEAPHG